MDHARYLNEMQQLAAQLMDAHNKLQILEQRRVDSGDTIAPVEAFPHIDAAIISNAQYAIQELGKFMNGDPSDGAKPFFRANFNRLLR